MKIKEVLPKIRLAIRGHPGKETNNCLHEI